MQRWREFGKLNHCSGVVSQLPGSRADLQTTRRGGSAAILSNFFVPGCPVWLAFGVLITDHPTFTETAMTSNKKLTTNLLSCALGALIAGAACTTESNYCIAVGGGFGHGGTAFVGRGFAVPTEGNCTSWSGFTKTASSVILTTSGTGCLSSNGKVLTVSVSSADPGYLGGGQLGSDYITLCPKGVRGCPLSGEDVGAFGGTAEPETCTTSLLELPATHD